jgi:hypothetical protein
MNLSRDPVPIYFKHITVGFFSRHYIELDAAITERNTCQTGSILPGGEGGEGEGDEEEAAKVIAFLGKDENGESVQVSPLRKQESSRSSPFWARTRMESLFRLVPSGSRRPRTRIESLFRLVPSGNRRVQGHRLPVQGQEWRVCSS